MLNLELPTDEAEFLQIMVGRGKLHYGTQCSLKIRAKAAWQLLIDRRVGGDKGISNLPGQAEYLDMLRALALLGKDEAEQDIMLEKIAQFTFRKYPKAYGR